MGKLQPLSTRDTGFGVVFGVSTSSGYEKSCLKYEAGIWTETKTMTQVRYDASYDHPLNEDTI